jgi:hypothetical protein
LVNGCGGVVTTFYEEENDCEQVYVEVRKACGGVACGDLGTVS